MVASMIQKLTFICKNGLVKGIFHSVPYPNVKSLLDGALAIEPGQIHILINKGSDRYEVTHLHILK